MEHPQMNPTPTPNSPAPVDTQRLRSFCDSMVRQFDRLKETGQVNLGTALLAVQSFEIAALRNDAPALLDELTQLREQVKCLVHNWQGQITRTNAERDKLREEVERLRDRESNPTKYEDLLRRLRNAIGFHAHVSEEECLNEAAGMRKAMVEARQKCQRLEVDLGWALLEKRDMPDRMPKISAKLKEAKAAIAERDSLRQQNERLLKEIEELKSRPTGLWKENY